MKNIFSIFKFFYTHMPKKNRGMYILTAITALAAAVIGGFLPILQKHIIDDAIAGELQVSFIVLLLVSGAVLSICFVLEKIIIDKIVIDMQRVFQEKLIVSALYKENAIVASRGAGAYIMTVFGDTERLTDLLKHNYFSFLSICILAVVAVMITLQWTVSFAIIVIISYVVVLSLTEVVLKKELASFKAFRELLVKVNPRVMEFIENRRSILGFSDIENNKKELFGSFQERDKMLASSIRYRTISKSIVEAVRNVALVVLIAASVYQIQSKTLEVSTFVAILSYLPVAFMPLIKVQDIRQDADRFELMRDKVVANIVEDNAFCVPASDDLRFSECAFKYSKDNEQYSIKDFSLDIHSKTGIVGLSGEGKSTILKILFGDKELSAGSCTLGNIRTDNITKSALYGSLLYCPQEAELFDADLTYNIVLNKEPLTEVEYRNKEGEIKHLIVKLFDEIIQNSLQSPVGKVFSQDCSRLYRDLFTVSLDSPLYTDFIETLAKECSANKEFLTDYLPKLLASRKYYIQERFDAIVSDLEITYLDGRNFGQRGKDISGGEKNKIALARLLLPAFNFYLIIDEPFTAMDAITEKKCFDVLKKYTKNQKALLISHKLNLIKDYCHHIAVLEDGKVSRIGTHDSLMQDSALYNDLYTHFTNQH
ncbi:MAG: ATP-binding cassette domain-containing protein [Christensenellales bacterium]